MFCTFILLPRLFKIHSYTTNIFRFLFCCVALKENVLSQANYSIWKLTSFLLSFQPNTLEAQRHVFKAKKVKKSRPCHVCHQPIVKLGSCCRGEFLAIVIYQVETRERFLIDWNSRQIKNSVSLLWVSTGEYM